MKIVEVQQQRRLIKREQIDRGGMYFHLIERFMFITIRITPCRYAGLARRESSLATITLRQLSKFLRYAASRNDDLWIVCISNERALVVAAVLSTIRLGCASTSHRGCEVQLVFYGRHHEKGSFDARCRFTAR